MEDDIVLNFPYTLHTLQSRWSPMLLFSDGQPGHWPGGYDPAAGRMLQTYPSSQFVTGAGQSVALVMDGIFSGEVGPEMATNPEFDSIGNWVIASSTMSIGEGVLTMTSSPSGQTCNITNPGSIGNVYVINWTLNSVSAGAVAAIFGTASAGYQSPGMTTPGTYISYGVGFGVPDRLGVRANGTTTAVVDSVSIKQVLGHHAYQPTALSRPTLGRWPKGGRRNLLAASEGVLVNSDHLSGATVSLVSGITPPSGCAVVVAVSEDVGTAALRRFCNRFPQTGTPDSVGSIHLKAAGRRRVRFGVAGGLVASAQFDLIDGVFIGASAGVIAEDAGDGWWRLSRLNSGGTVISTNILVLGDDGSVEYNGDGRIAVYATGSQAELAASHVATPYQRVTTGNEVTEVGVPDIWHLSNDGGDSLAVTLPAGLYGRAWVDAAGVVSVDSVTDPTSIEVGSTQVDVILRLGSFTPTEETNIRSYWKGVYT